MAARSASGRACSSWVIVIGPGRRTYRTGGTPRGSGSLGVPGAARRVARGAQVRRDELARGLRVGAAQRVGDSAMLGDEAFGVSRVAGERDRRDALLAVAQRVVQTREDRVARGVDDRPVEEAGRLPELPPVPPPPRGRPPPGGARRGARRGKGGAGLAAPPPPPPAGGDRASGGGERGGGLGGELGAARRGGATRAVLLDEQPRLEDVLNLGGRDRHDERAALGVELEEALGLQLDERLAYRRAAQAELLGELVLREQRAAGERAVEQALLDVRVHPCPGRARAGERAGRGGGRRPGLDRFGRRLHW